MKHIFRPLAFSLMGVLILILIAASVCETLLGTDVAVRWFYTAPWTLILWAAAAISGIVCLLMQRVWKQAVTCLLHLSFVVILGGALVTHLWGYQGEVHLRLSGTADTPSISLPFSLTLTDFYPEYYPGTQAPMDFVSELLLVDATDTIVGRVSMNHIFTYRHYRFYQSRYDSDARGTVLSVSHDPWGIGITYAGYALLLFSLIAFFFQRNTRFRALLHSPLLRKTALIALLALSASAPLRADDNSRPLTLDRPTAEEFCRLYVYYNDRVCPMSTLAHDFTVKLCGKNTWKGLSAEQVFCGWLFYYDSWANELCIKIKGNDTRTLLNAHGKYVRLNDFTAHGTYLLADRLLIGDRNARAADEKFRLVSMICTASMLKIYPVSSLQSQPALLWYSWVDRLPADIPFEDWQFVTGSMEYVSLCIARGADSETQDALRRIRQWQCEKAGPDALPSPTRFEAERCYTLIDRPAPVAIACTVLGLLLFFAACLLLSRGRTFAPALHLVLTLLICTLCLYLTVLLTLRWLVSGYIPLSNGHETMRFLAWTSALLTATFALRTRFLVPDRRSPLAGVVLSFGFLLCGMTLMVSMMSSSNPQITPLMPVLRSPLLTLHVAVIMLAYCLLAFVMLNGLSALMLALLARCQRRSLSGGLRRQLERLQVVSQIILYPALFLLTIGIFIGAVWANVSWGRYWGWDPKEVWALITMLVYAALLHTRSLPFLRRPLTFHIASVLAFFFVLFTYFGVNFLLGGLHSYA